MVFALVILTVLVFFAVDFFLRKEDRQIASKAREHNSPIFLSPEQSLLPLQNRDQRMYHNSHSWALPDKKGPVYLGFDDFVSWLFPDTVQVSALPAKGHVIHQGEKIWSVGNSHRKVDLCSPLSGTVLEINPAFRLGIPLNSQDVEQSWIAKILPGTESAEYANLLPAHQAEQFTALLKDDLIFTTQKEFLLNDGGTPDTAFFDQLDEDEWQRLTARYFPLQNFPVIHSSSR